MTVVVSCPEQPHLDQPGEAGTWGRGGGACDVCVTLALCEGTCPTTSHGPLPIMAAAASSSLPCHPPSQQRLTCVTPWDCVDGCRWRSPLPCPSRPSSWSPPPSSSSRASGAPAAWAPPWTVAAAMAPRSSSRRRVAGRAAPAGPKPVTGLMCMSQVGAMLLSDQEGVCFWGVAGWGGVRQGGVGWGGHQEGRGGSTLGWQDSHSGGS